jgi:hypothetical protein
MTADDPDGSAEPRLVSRVLVTWLELTVVGLAGAFLGAAASGPVAFVAYLATSLATVGVLLYNVNELVRSWIVTGPATPD